MKKLNTLHILVLPQIIILLNTLVTIVLLSTSQFLLLSLVQYPTLTMLENHQTSLFIVTLQGNTPSSPGQLQRIPLNVLL